jgi:TatA/E family protein of Tat protein translocase
MQGGEVIIILLVALVVFGPARLPDIARRLGAWTAELRDAARDIRLGLEAEVGDLKQVADDIKEPLDSLSKTRDELRREVDGVGISRLDWKGPAPESGPTADDAMADLDQIEEAAGIKPQSGPNPGQVMDELEAVEQEGPDPETGQEEGGM